MSVVYLAEQSEPVKRRLALKILKPGMDSKQIIARFESERQALAVLDHPNIAKVFDGGVAESGRPYFVMERVRGVPITDYCDDQRLSNEARLKIFIEVCSAVQHAHNKGLIHRDLKPSNILVGVVDGRPHPRIIDFGIAKATSAPLTEQTLVTRIGQVIGTPQYMSPEQANITGLDVDTRADVYSLGVVLYELLVGAVPVDVRGVSDPAIHVALREKDPPRPSTRYTDLGDTREEVAKARRTEPDGLRRQLRGDLDWIVMRAIERDRTRRYETVNALAMECRRFLDHQPVLARPPSAGYLLNRFIRRNMMAVVAASVAVLAVVAGAAVAMLGYVRATEAEQAAIIEAETSSQVSDFLVRLFEVSDPSEARGNTITAREILDRGTASIDEDLAGQPEVQATLMQTMGRVYHKLGLYENADILLQRALASRRRMQGDPVELATGLQLRAELLVDRGDYEEAGQLLDEAMSIVDVGGSDPEQVVSLLNTRAFLYQNQARYSEAEAILTRALSLLPSSDSAAQTDIADSLTSLAIVYRKTGAYDEAEAAFLRALAIREYVLGPDHPAVATTLNSMSILYIRRKDWDMAEQLQLRAMAIREEALGEQHPEFAKSLNNLAGIYIMRGDKADGIPYLERALRIREATLGSDHPSLGEAMHNLAVLHYDLEDYEEAMTWETRAISIKKRALNPGHPDLALSLHNYALILSELGRYDESEALLQQVLDMQAEALGQSHPARISTLKSYRKLLLATNRDADAERTMHEIRELEEGD